MERCGGGGRVDPRWRHHDNSRRSWRRLQIVRLATSDCEWHHSLYDHFESVRLLSPAEVAEALGVSRITVLRMIRAGRLAAVKLGPNANASIRIDPDDLAALLVPVPADEPETLPLAEVAARVGKSEAWAVAQASVLPTVSSPDGPPCSRSPVCARGTVPPRPTSRREAPHERTVGRPVGQPPLRAHLPGAAGGDLPNGGNHWCAGCPGASKPACCSHEPPAPAPPGRDP